MTPESGRRHIAHLGRILRKRKAFTFGRGDTDRAFIRRRMGLVAMTLAYLAWWIYRGLTGYWFLPDVGLIAGYLIPVAVIGWALWLTRYLVRAQLGLKVLARHGVENVYQLPDSVTGVDGEGTAAQAAATPPA
ncbi:hypothetical protein OVA24_17255 [Luteolibacter sp. SL250]|uniref:hypothetical protein n=1 Tax=Luteolibacter sp. SL250 TaxID=2995170 RepID=UPI00226D674B|nr:hypothetical protein [Luteolibacter sp. SL250]WAC18979.1 hypothetical protein OVA24_17255 [Luteolibacter sp. SL250]